MAYCKNCGKEIDDKAVVCPACGVSQQDKPTVVDSGNIGWAVLGCCIPLVGLILFLVWGRIRSPIPQRKRASARWLV